MRGDLPQHFGEAHTGYVKYTRVASATTNVTDLYRIELELNELSSNSTFVLFFTWKGLDEKLAADVVSLTLQTKPTSPPASGKMNFNQRTSLSAIRKAIAQALAILEIYITILTLDENTIQPTRLQGFEVQFVVTEPQNQETPSPLDMVKSLDSNKVLLKTFLPSLNADAQITSSAVVYTSQKPQFMYSPRIIYVTNTTMTIEAIQNVAGRVYGILVSADSPAPTS